MDNNNGNTENLIELLLNIEQLEKMIEKKLEKENEGCQG